MTQSIPPKVPRSLLKVLLRSDPSTKTGGCAMSCLWWGVERIGPNISAVPSELKFRSLKRPVFRRFYVEVCYR
ncbi:hypothetical protein PHLCEN_2v6323 [Hermanssonia centrifuga]|uniref:Uncharacterized protein n=1 Tax=Hermanssonia centrifuga TaxID=98765 RepID=A0A2R6NZX0_9APHY|nr:hypothetical protein PHLCEN_2v6323 [Hermanssonia centrifuga]